jgi:transposase-like protein
MKEEKNTLQQPTLPLNFFKQFKSKEEFHSFFNSLFRQGVDVSDGTVFNVTARITEHVKEWQSRSLEPVYYVVWMDGIMLRIRHSCKYINKCIYLVVGFKKDGLKEVLGMWTAESE